MLHEKIRLVGAYPITKTEAVQNQVGPNTFQYAIFGSGSYYADVTQEDWYTGANIGQELYVDAELGDDTTGDGSVNAPYETLNKAIESLTDVGTTVNKHAVIYLAGNSEYELEWDEGGDNRIETINSDFAGEGIIFSGYGSYTPTIKLQNRSTDNYAADTALKTSVVLEIYPKETFTWAEYDVMVVAGVNGGIYYMDAYKSNYDYSDCTKISTETGTQIWTDCIAANDSIYLHSGHHSSTYSMMIFTAPSVAMTSVDMIDSTFNYWLVNYDRHQLGVWGNRVVVAVQGNDATQKQWLTWIDGYNVCHNHNLSVSLDKYYYSGASVLSSTNIFAINNYLYFNAGNKIYKAIEKDDADKVEYTTWTNCRVATTANITIGSALKNGNLLDGETLVNGDRVLVKNQTTKSQNGIYIVDAVPYRATDADSASEINYHRVYVTSGTANGGYKFFTTTNSVSAVGTDNIEFSSTWVDNDLLTVTEVQEIPSLVAITKREGTTQVYALTTTGEVWYSADPETVTFSKIVQLDEVSGWRFIKVTDEGIWTFAFTYAWNDAIGDLYDYPLTTRENRIYGAYLDGVLMERGNIQSVASSPNYRYYILHKMTSPTYASTYITTLIVPKSIITSGDFNLMGYNVKFDGQNKYNGISGISGGGKYIEAIDCNYGCHFNRPAGYAGTTDANIWKYSISNSVGKNNNVDWLVPMNTVSTVTKPLIANNISNGSTISTQYVDCASAEIQLVDKCVFYGNSTGVYGEATINMTNCICDNCGTGAYVDKLLASETMIRRYSSTKASPVLSNVYTGRPGFVDALNNDFRLKTTYNGYKFDSPYIKDGSLEYTEEAGVYDFTRTTTFGTAEYDNVIPIMWDELSISESPVNTKTVMTPTGEYLEWSPNIGETKRIFEYSWNDNTSDSDSSVRRQFNYTFRDLMSYRDTVFKMGFDDGNNGWKPLFTFTNIRHDTTKTDLWAIVTTSNTIYKNELRGLWIYIPSLDDYMLILSNTASSNGSFSVELYNNTGLELTGVNDASPHCDYWHVMVSNQSGQTNKVWKFFANDTNRPLPVAGYKLKLYETWKDINE